MGERKVLNKYYPPDFDPADIPRGKREKDNAMKVRMMLPMTVRCSTCGEFMYKGTKFNCKKEDVAGESYLGMQIFRFYMRCRKCSSEITYKTDLQNMDYVVEAGATRNFEQWKAEQTLEEAIKEKRANEDEDRVKKLENKTADSKREMDIMDALDDMIQIRGQQQHITPEQAIEALRAKAQAAGGEPGDNDGLPPEDEKMLQDMITGGAFTQRVTDGDASDDSDNERSRLAPPKVPHLAQRPAAQAKQPSLKVKAIVKRKTPVSEDDTERTKFQRTGLHVEEDMPTAPSRKPPTVTASGLGLLGAYESSEESG